MNNLIEQDSTSLTQFSSVQTEIEKSRALQEVQGAIVMARKFPRNEAFALEKLKKTAKNLKFAEQAIYAYPRGGSMITGPSIRAAETLAAYWGNVLYGTKELSRNYTEHSSEVMSYCWDMETNVRSERFFKVSHVRETKGGGYTLTSDRDIYEKVANEGSRRLRSSILAIIPKYVTDELMEYCEATLVGSTGKTLEERISEMLEKFEQIGISKEIIEKKMGVKVDKFVAKNVVMLGYIYNSIKDNVAPATQFFDIPTPVQEQVNSALKKSKSKLKSDTKSEPVQEALINAKNNEDYEL